MFSTRQLLIAADEAQPGIAGERTGQQPGLAQHLETVADAEHRQPVVGRLHDLRDHRGEARDGAGAQVIAVGKAAGQHDRVDAVKLGIGVPERHRLRAGEGHGAQGITVVEGSWKGHNADADRHASTVVERGLL